MTDEMDEMEEIIIEFIAEAEESLEKIEPLFVELERKGHDKDMLNDIFRSMHTIKGAAGFLGFQLIVSVAHSSENIMKKLRDGEISLSKELMDVILKSIDMLRLLLEHIKAKDGIEEDITHLVKELEAALNIAISGTGTAEESEEPVKTGQAADEPHQEPEIAGIPESTQNPGVQTESLAGGEQKNPEAIQAAKDIVQKPKETAQNLRVDIERIDKVMDLAGEMRSEERRVGKECRSRWSPYH